jgi:membrane associated rhomboid family serine protease/Flp pilus assembly protein TadD
LENGAQPEQETPQEEKPKTGYMTPAVSALIAANIVVFALMAVTSGSAALSGPSNQVLLNFGANYGIRTMFGEYWRIFTNIFVHLGLLHCFMNMWIFAVMGPITERLYGSLKFTVVYLFAGLIASLTSIYISPQSISAGASGAIFGIFGLWFGFLIANKKILQENFVKSNMKSTVVFLIMVLVSGFMRSGTDNAAHIGGVVAGFISGFLLSPLIPDQARWKGKDSVGVLLMLLMLGGAFYLSYTRTHQFTAVQSVVLSPADLKEPTRLLKNNKPQEALKILDTLLLKQPNHPQAHYLRAHAYALLSDDRKAIADIDIVLKKLPDLLPALLFKAQRQLNLMQFQDALVTANRAIELNSTDPVGFLLRSTIYDRLDNTAKSLEDSNEAVRLAPENANAYSNRGYSYINLGLTEDAIRDFTKAIKLDPGLIGAMNGRMFAYFMHSDYIECDRQCMDILAKVGLQDRCAPYAVMMSAICRKQLHEDNLRNAMLIQAVQRLPADHWPYPIIQYMAGQTTYDAVFQKATDNDKMTEAKTYIAFDLLASNKAAEASPMLLWVKEHGNKTFNEFDLVSSLLSKAGK